MVHTYRENESLVYVNGRLAGSNTEDGPPLAIKTPARFWIGGWYDNYTFVGEIDEVRISKVTRSAEWIRLQYENQKPMQTLVGPLVQPGNEFSVSPERAVVEEGQSAEFIAKAGGAEKVYWVLKRNGREEVVATDRFRFAFPAGRVSGDATATLQLKAVDADGVKTKDIAIAVKEAIPEPVFTLKAPATWDGRATIEVELQIANLRAMQARNAGELKFEWNAGPFAVIKEVVPGKLRLLRAQNSGRLTVSATVSNGGQAVTQSVSIEVTEPKSDAWVARVPAKDEKPEDGQFLCTRRQEPRHAALHRQARRCRRQCLCEALCRRQAHGNGDGQARRGHDLRPGREAQAGTHQVPHRVRNDRRRQRHGSACRDQPRLWRCLHHQRPVQRRGH